jgi:hypothetical protein
MQIHAWMTGDGDLARPGRMLELSMAAGGCHFVPTLIVEHS